ncbi:MAG: metal ABC transporter ATP-binding protein [Paracoccaceae bacterium]|nr:metal ABC transporter ATP-binding protein [Paracoccaceae bacterium]MDE2738919.1 metal ABC transporter ATP-binding protein [Paracoccaceae bacterium]MXZ50958.1 metal ABC transporter ATP-binding protein [Paracoccaceae bacterium]MYF45715.1 metal ABC transporter ATP-binding protein [Paracoccaceae bacterium]MYG09691.1 metal ABC transporter ATP-binding protein [Paracoccaceae bacterium]
MSLVKFDGVGFSYQDKLVVHDISFTVEPGIFLTIVGPNGSGKTTILKLIIGAYNPTKGAIVRDADLRVGYVPQKLNVNDTIPIDVNCFLNLGRKFPNKKIRSIAEETGIAHLMRTPLLSLSGGQTQRVLYARALLAEPNLLIMDEATQGMDAEGEERFYRLVNDYRDRTNCAIIMVSHEMHVVSSFSNWVICLNGHICCQGEPSLIFEDEKFVELFGRFPQNELAYYPHKHDHSHDVV